MPAERARGLKIDMYIDSDGKPVVFKAHSSYLNCECGTTSFDQDQTIGLHLVGEILGNPTLHRDDCQAYPWRRRGNGQKTIERIQKRRVEEEARKEKRAQKEKARMIKNVARKQSVEVMAEPVIDPRKNCICDLVELFEGFSQGIVGCTDKYAAERRMIKDGQIRMLGKPCEAHELCCEECHYALLDSNWRNSQQMRVENTSADLEARAASGILNNEAGRNFTSTEPLEPPRYFSTKLSPEPASAADAIKACRTRKTLLKSAIEEKAQQDLQRLARDILRAAGFHPFLPPLNAHLGVPEDLKCWILGL